MYTYTGAKKGGFKMDSLFLLLGLTGFIGLNSFLIKILRLDKYAHKDNRISKDELGKGMQL